MYWIVNIKKKQYITVPNTNAFFDGDWRLKTPWPEESYSFLTAQRVHSDQLFFGDTVQNATAFFGYDLCRDGMLMGVYYDADVHKKGEVRFVVERFRRNHDVVSISYYPLQRAFKKSLYAALVDAGVPVSNHESDLYFEKNDTSTEMIKDYKEHTISTFRNQRTGTTWYEALFQYVPFWEAVEKKCSVIRGDKAPSK